MDLKTLVDPPFAQDPPVKLNIDARILGMVCAILGALGALFALFALLAIGTFFAVYGHGGIFAFALVGALVLIAAGVLAAVGGWRMYNGNPEGKRLVIYSLAIDFIGQIVYGIGFANLGNLIVSLVVIAAVYYLVVISRFAQSTPPAAPPTPR
jgi:hypothetical protein